MQALQTDDVVDQVLRASRALVAVAARSLADEAETITLPQLRAIVFLRSTGGATMGALAEELSCSASAATRLCDRLVAKELVERQHRPDNRREVVVVATPTARRLVDRVTARRRAELERIVDAIPQAQRAGLVRGLRAFAEAAGEAESHDGALGWEL